MMRPAYLTMGISALRTIVNLYWSQATLTDLRLASVVTTPSRGMVFFPLAEKKSTARIERL